MIIGITGGIGSGKSTIANELARRGYAVYDCDREAKRIIAEDEEMKQAVVALLGEEAFEGRRYNTAYVARRVFAEPEVLERLNAIVHPAVQKDILYRAALSQTQPVLFVESAILFEAGIDRLCDKIVLVEAPEEVRIARTIARDYDNDASSANINKVRARIRAQKTSAGTEALQRYSVLTVVNDGTSVLSRIVDLVCDFAAY